MAEQLPKRQKTQLARATPEQLTRVKKTRRACAIPEQLADGKILSDVTAVSRFADLNFRVIEDELGDRYDGPDEDW